MGVEEIYDIRNIHPVDTQQVFIESQIMDSNTDNLLGVSMPQDIAHFIPFLDKNHWKAMTEKNC